jgi:hypothetical protein
MNLPRTREHSNFIKDNHHRTNIMFVRQASIGIVNDDQSNKKTLSKMIALNTTTPLYIDQASLDIVADKQVRSFVYVITFNVKFVIANKSLDYTLFCLI